MRRLALVVTLAVSAALAPGSRVLAQPPPQPRFWSGGGDWALMGEATIVGRSDVDVIRVGREQGRFRRILMTVENADMVLDAFRVTFQNREVYDQAVNMGFREGTRSRAFDLPGEARVIESVTIWARDLRGGGRPLVRIWGERERGGPPGPPPAPPPQAQQPRYWSGGGDWALLGETTIQGRRDVDVIRIGREQGRFRKILMTVENADMVLNGFRVTFMNGEVHDQNVNMAFREGSRSTAFDLPGDARVIDNIVISARDLRGGGRPLLRVWGEKGRGPAGPPGGIVVPPPPPGVAVPPPPPPRYWTGGGEWTLLGEATIQGRRDVDVIRVSREQGRFTKILMTVENADMVLYGFRVTFKNGEVFDQNLNIGFREGSRSSAIDLPGDARMIDSIAIFARDLRGGGRPLLRVWGERGRGGGHGDGFGQYGGSTWQSLGTVTADARRDVDTIQVSPRERRFRAIQLAVHDSDLQMFDIVVQFMNGEVFRPQVRPFFREGSRSQVIDLPGEARAIQSVTFRYRDLGRRDGRAKVELLAR